MRLVRFLNSEMYMRLPFPHPGQVAPETPAVPQTGHSIGTAPRMVPVTLAVSVMSHISRAGEICLGVREVR